MNGENNPDKMAALLAAINHGKPVRADGEGFIVAIPRDHYAVKLPSLAPPRLMATVALVDVSDFMAYVKKWASPASTVFLTVQPGGVEATAFIDYHGAGAGQLRSADWLEHRVELCVGISDSLKRWISICEKQMGQEDFARFIDDNAVDVENPDSAALVEMALKLEGSSNAKFTAKRDPVSGSCTMNYEEENTTGAVKIPRELSLLLPVLHRGPPVLVKVMLMWRVNTGKPTFSIRIPGLAHLIEEACLRLKATLTEGISPTPVYLGEVAEGSIPKREQPEVMAARV